ncbi:PKD domain-containing protein [Aquimarina sp. Aq78]|uniref:PKD domain-containing protein n=1 Tax=Aquimarina sp. Aq78 TaxID=1191889 RepID=UPI000D5541C7|nr:PKD domain-containing protein [Aquimarina sp. Aq78]
MKKIVIVFFLFCYGLHAQEEFTPDYISYYSKYTPVTPNASSFLQYGNTPVNHATGIPQINIPLYTIQEDGVSIPISLSYHASGVKVDELASVVGLKWTLNAGGGIFRQVNDKIDEEGWLVPSKRGRVTPEWLTQYPVHHFQTQNTIATSDLHDDYHPDDFSFNFTGHSGNFIFDKNGDVADDFKDDLYIGTLPLTNNHFNFFSKDSQGNTFYFDNAKETNISHVANVMGTSLSDVTRSSNVSGWMLDRIITKNSKEVNFTYSPYTFQYTLTGISQSLINAPGCGTEALETCGCLGSSSGPVVNKTTLSTTTATYTPTNQLVSAIETSGVKVTFNYIDDTTLSTWKKKLTSIDILDKIKNRTRSFVFTYGKFGGDPRLRLEQVQEIGFNGVSKPPHKFYYASGDLPQKGNKAKDYAGYYNGETNNQTIVPFSIQAFNILNTTDRQKLADRSEYINYLKIGTLNKIEYPTGGSTTFTYEPNSVSAPENSNPNYVPKDVPISQADEYFTSGGYRVFRTPFTIAKDLSHLGTPVTYNAASTICNFDPQNPSIDCSRFNIYPKQSDGSLGAPIFSPFLVIGAEGSINLFKGDYVLELKIEESKLLANPSAQISVNLGWYEDEGTQTHYTGGLRVNTITDKDANDQSAKTTKYTYENLIGYNFDVSTYQKSYGQLGVRSVFSSDNIWLNPELTKSGHFYGKVTIEKLSDQGNIKTIEEYKETFKQKTYAPVMAKQEHYEGDSKVKAIVFDYENTIESHLQFYVLADKDLCYNFASASPQIIGYSGVNGANYYHRRNVLSKKTEIDYYHKIGEPFKASVVQYKYQYNNDLQVIKEELDGRLYADNEQAIEAKNYSIRPNGKHVEIRYTYPVDHQSQNTTLATLHNNNQVALPISKKVYTNGTLIQGQYMNYDTRGNTIATYRHNKGKATHQFIAGHIPSDYELYEQYTIEAGKPVEVQRKKGLPTAILWDVTYNYMLAKLVGVTKIELDEITAAIDLKSITDSSLNTIYNNLRTALPNAMVSTYTYDPLVGVTSMTDPEGYTTYYQYDDMSRLQYTLDHEQYVAQQLRYNYQGQQSDVLRGVRISFPSFGSVQPNQAVTFTANTSGSGGANLYTWSVNGTQEQCDGTTSFTKTFASEGTYTISVLAYNTQTKHRVSTTINVVVAYPPITIPVLSANYSSVITGTNVNFSASGIGGGTGDLRYEWYVNNIKQASTATTFTYTTNTAGTYNVYFKVIDNRSGKSTDSEVRLLHMYNPLIAPVISASKAHIVQGTTTTFTASGIGGGTGLRLYQWYVNDVKQSATGTTYSYNFPNSGTYTIKFRVVDRGLENSYYQWGGNAPVLKSYPGMVANSSQSHTSISGTNPSVSFSITSLTGGSGNSQITWKAYNSINLSQALGSGSGTNFGFSNFSNGTHEYTIQAKIKDNLTGQEITKVMIVVATVSTDTGGGGGNTGEQH